MAKRKKKPAKKKDVTRQARALGLRAIASVTELGKLIPVADQMSCEFVGLVLDYVNREAAKIRRKC